MNTKKQGDQGLGQAIAYFTTMGWTVMVPLTDSQDYDLVVDEGEGELYTVQVKHTTYKRNNHYQVGFSIKGGNNGGLIKDAHDVKFDKAFVYTPEGSYYIPRTEFTTKCLTLSESGKYSAFKI